MNKAEYLALLEQRLEKYFDIIEGGVYGGKKYDIAASYAARENQTVLFKENVMDYSESKEVCLVSAIGGSNRTETAGDTVSAPDVVADASADLASLPQTALDLAGVVSRHHKTTTVLRVFISESAAPKELVRLVKHFSWDKPFKFGFCGWASVKTVLVDLEKGRVYTNGAAHDVKTMFIPVYTAKKH